MGGAPVVPGRARQDEVAPPQVIRSGNHAAQRGAAVGHWLDFWHSGFVQQERKLPANLLFLTAARVLDLLLNIFVRLLSSASARMPTALEYCRTYGREPMFLTALECLRRRKKK